MKKLLLSAALIGVAALAITAKKNNDPVVMKVNDREVTLSEFEYLYNKNNNQQLTPLTFDEYVDMFVNYKLKVADALEAGVDTTASFKAEFEKFRRDLAEPFLQDSTVMEQLVDEAYSHMAEDVYVSHIMLPPNADNVVETLDSLRNAINQGLTTFEEAARQYSVDRGSAARGGHMGWVTGMSPYPWAFEKASYDTPVGEISEVVNSGVGYHLILPEKRRPNRGEVKVEHILLMTRGLSDDEKAQVKVRIDSLYAVATPTNFADLARKYSDDKGSARDGGLIDWFGAGRMVAEFDSVSFALPNGAISEPFATTYGYHIVHKLDQRGIQPLSELREGIQEMIASDTRASMPRRAALDRIAARSNSMSIPDYKTAVKALFTPGQAADSTVIAGIYAINAPAYRINGNVVTLSEVLAAAPSLPLRAGLDPYSVQQVLERTVSNAYDRALIDYEMERLQTEEPSYRNLVNEYRDGIMLFDISNAKVWERASKDTEGLKKYFEENRAKYSNWTSPKYKAYVIFASNDSVLGEVKKYIDANYGGQKITEIDQEKFTSDIKKKFPRNARVERVIAAQGENPYTDYLGFGGERPVAKGSAWDSYMDFAAEIIPQPEEVSDVKGAVVTDYQGLLEQQWLDELHKKYKVEINKKQLKKANK